MVNMLPIIDPNEVVADLARVPACHVEETVIIFHQASAQLGIQE